MPQFNYDDIVSELHKAAAASGSGNGVISAEDSFNQTILKTASAVDPTGNVDFDIARGAAFAEGVLSKLDNSMPKSATVVVPLVGNDSGNAPAPADQPTLGKQVATPNEVGKGMTNEDKVKLVDSLLQQLVAGFGYGPSTVNVSGDYQVVGTPKPSVAIPAAAPSAIEKASAAEGVLVNLLTKYASAEDATDPETQNSFFKLASAAEDVLEQEFGPDNYDHEAIEKVASAMIEDYLDELEKEAEYEYAGQKIAESFSNTLQKSAAAEAEIAELYKYASALLDENCGAGNYTESDIEELASGLYARATGGSKAAAILNNL